MQTIKKLSILCLSFVVFSLGLTFAFPNKIDSNNAQLLQSFEDKHINCIRMNAFMRENYPFLFLDSNIPFLSREDKLAIEKDYDIYFRFLSIVSGKSSPYNLDCGHYIIKNPDWIHLEENEQLAIWYDSNKNRIPCDLFEEFYNLEKGIREGPKIRTEDFNEYLRISEVFFDSIYNKMEEFEKKYSCFLEVDSVKEVP